MAGCRVRTTNGMPMKTRAMTIAEARERDLDPERREEPTEPAALDEERGQRDAGDRGRERERQVDEGVEEPPAREPVAHEHPGDDEPKTG
jgi:hypothetical protein